VLAGEADKRESNIPRGMLDSPAPLSMDRAIPAMTWARQNVFDYVERFYNRQHHHRCLDGISPGAFERTSRGDLGLFTVAGLSQLESVHHAYEAGALLSPINE